MSGASTIDGVDYLLLAALPGMGKGNQMRYSESTVLDSYNNTACGHTIVNTLERAG